MRRRPSSAEILDLSHTSVNRSAEGKEFSQRFENPLASAHRDKPVMNESDFLRPRLVYFHAADFSSDVLFLFQSGMSQSLHTSARIFGEKDFSVNRSSRQD